MKSYKDPSFQERIDRAAEAKQKALDKLRAKPPVDEKILAERQAARLKREAAEQEKRAARKAAEQEAKEAKAAKAAAEAKAAAPTKTEAERKAERDARYAARKNRK
ncbi:DUF6481 family protein [Sphingosinicella rhizophila]|uniref:DUF6481 family protein n=1 Tax=Sphingosinicella rhizophila TaxID=3050082 RepID=A0ABU3Q9H1_9SPHN|nr:DUF6481 family protein [Sphingosinicella sp. GR2756]MDT9600039.1 DUF6481 family protein [Sphingosinicella sp. GR2756]